MKYSGKPINLDKYYLESQDSTRNYVFEYKAKNPENCNLRDNHNNFFFKRNIFSKDLHIGDFLASIIGEKVGFKVCDATLYKTLLPNGKFDIGILSYVSLSEDDFLILPETIIKEYLKSKNEKFSSLLDVETIFQSMLYSVTKNNRPYEEFLDFKQDFINMVIYDSKFMIFDRSIDNWYFRKNKNSGAIDLYPMFDNEMILGFDQDLEDLEPNLITKEFVEEIDRQKTIEVLTPIDVMNGNRHADYHDIIKYLLRKYPKETTTAIAHVKEFTIQDLEKELDRIEDLSQLRKELTMKLFLKREMEIYKIYDEYNKDENIKRYQNR